VKLVEGRSQIRGLKVRPHSRGEDQFGVGRFPEEKIAEALLAPGSDQEIHRRRQARRDRLLRWNAAAANGFQDGLPARVVDGQLKVEGTAGGGEALGAGNRSAESVGQALPPAQHAQPDPVLPATRGLAAQEDGEEIEQGADLVRGPPPVVRRESIKRQGGDAEGGRRLHYAAHRLGAGAMPLYPLASLCGSPASVTVHDDGHVHKLHASAERQFCKVLFNAK
jgi:hypothetical protein